MSGVYESRIGIVPGCYGGSTGLLLIDVGPERGAVSRETTAVIVGRYLYRDIKRPPKDRVLIRSGREKSCASGIEHAFIRGRVAS